MKETYTIQEVALLFRCRKRVIQARLVEGQFDYTVDGNGITRITRESILKHLPELEKKNNI